MAIPIRATVTCPHCGASAEVIIADTSVGPKGRVSRTPIYSMLAHPDWPQTREAQGGATRVWLGCGACGADRIATVEEVAQGARGGPRSR